jgi:hypothetical protein
MECLNCYHDVEEHDAEAGCLHDFGEGYCICILPHAIAETYHRTTDAAGQKYVDNDDLHRIIYSG